MWAYISISLPDNNMHCNWYWNGRMQERQVSRETGHVQLPWVKPEESAMWSPAVLACSTPFGTLFTFIYGQWTEMTFITQSQRCFMKLDWGRYSLFQGCPYSLVSSISGKVRGNWGVTKALHNSDHRLLWSISHILPLLFIILSYLFIYFPLNLPPTESTFCQRHQFNHCDTLEKPNKS